MPVRARHRTATAALAAALVGGLPLAAGAAWAQPSAPEDGKQVTFSGSGVGVLLCTSEPDQTRLDVAAQSTVTFVNRTGGQATLRVDGQDAGSVGADQAVPVVFHRGPVAVSMVPKCGLNLNENFGTVTVEVAAASEAAPPAAPASGTPAAGSGSPAGGSTHPAPAQHADPATTPAGPTNPTDPAAQDFPTDGATLPSGSENAAGVADSDNTVAAGNVAVSAPITVASTRKGANGLLALVAVIFVLGTGAGAIRAILSQRASRARAA